MLSSNIRRSPVAAPTVAVNTGPTIGAITIEPTTIAGESMRTPTTAMTALRKIIDRNDVDLSQQDAATIDGNDGWITIVTTVDSDEETITLRESRPVG